MEEADLSSHISFVHENTEIDTGLRYRHSKVKQDAMYGMNYCNMIIKQLDLENMSPESPRLEEPKVGCGWLHVCGRCSHSLELSFLSRILSIGRRKVVTQNSKNGSYRRCKSQGDIG
jgi:hypothetical protein